MLYFLYNSTGIFQVVFPSSADFTHIWLDDERRTKIDRGGGEKDKDD